mmetsp:Transcript_16565/g.23535  ORF Transcript_16565/g.23535 Transcript_16565/m.23535 type:complete len:307 (+) Transcript_16565:81-1001(+)|eukprot:CAMPEP_0184863010 /NCGR_PEP_ID=MMETSP0580-20130426/8269_1 /TAXON_ID=1118495 /ORGANISM="Dactyliosolen fragilissimus" /LENGTH=306 /DNA_ID=CAMNT_0027361047 /DNA_START=22 /DNA_END=942 /DNA_ORIENTATION=-
MPSTNATKQKDIIDKTRSMSATEYRQTDNVRSIAMATSRFYNQVSNGISILQQQHGYSKENASTLILNTICQNLEPIGEEEVYRVMEKLGLGMNHASKTATIANALKITRAQRSLSTADAIDYLAAQISVTKLLNGVGKGDKSPHPSVSYSTNISHTVETFVNNIKSPTDQDSGYKKLTCKKSIITSSTIKHTGLKSTSQNHMKSKSTKISRKRIVTDNSLKCTVRNSCKLLDDKVKTSDEMNSKIVEKVIMVKEHKSQNPEQVTHRNKCTSPPGVRSKRTNTHCMNDLEDTSQQPPAKRPRSSSV